MIKRRVAVAAIKITDSGPRRILEEFLICANNYEGQNLIFDVYVGVDFGHLESYENINFIKVKDIYLKSFVHRFFWDKYVVRKISEKVDYIHWLSIQDFSLNVDIPHSVYIHNALFYARPELNWFRYEMKEIIRALVMKFFIGLNISDNSIIIVQQESVKDQLKKKYKRLPKILVSPPNGVYENHAFEGLENMHCRSFFYPAMPRVFKGHNFLFTCALKNPDIVFYVTLSGKENSLSKTLFRRYGHLKNVKWLGRLSKNEVAYYYRLCDFVFFPSELETWGLPLTESRAFGKPILVISDSEYLNGPLAGYHGTFCIDRKVGAFNEFVENPLKHRIHLSHDSQIVTWSEIFCRISDNL